MNKCLQCKKEMPLGESILGAVCKKCTRINHNQVTGKVKKK